jgi:hypothetical protein
MFLEHWRGMRRPSTLDRLNRQLLDRVQTAGDVFLTGTELAGRFVLRACIVNFHTAEPDRDALVGTIRAAGEHLRTEDVASAR